MATHCSGSSVGVTVLCFIKGMSRYTMTHLMVEHVMRLAEGGQTFEGDRMRVGSDTGAGERQRIDRSRRVNDRKRGGYVLQHRMYGR